MSLLNIQRIREDFPILAQEIKGYPLVYFDNGASTQKPRQVIERIVRYYERENANVHRGIHSLSQLATDHYEAARETVASFINAPSSRCIVFTRGTTEAINLVAASWGEANIQAGDNIVLSELEHHSNLVPWQLLAQRKGAQLRFIPVSEVGQLELEALDSLVDTKTKLIAINHMSNALGTVHDVARVQKAAQAVGAKLLLDGAQSVPHLPTDVQALQCDFLAFSGHKLAAPTGIGVLYAREELLEAMPPYQGGGEMIREVWLEHSTWADLPYKFEAGTPNIAGAIGLAAAMDYLTAIGMEKIHAHEQMLTAYALEKLKNLPGIRIYGPEDVRLRGGIVSFNFEGIHHQDIGAMLDEQGVAIRTGHHCCQPLMRRYGILGTARASFYLYNTPEEIDRLAAGLEKIQALFARAAQRQAKRSQAREKEKA